MAALALIPSPTPPNSVFRLQSVLALVPEPRPSCTPAPTATTKAAFSAFLTRRQSLVTTLANTRLSLSRSAFASFRSALQPASRAASRPAHASLRPATIHSALSFYHCSHSSSPPLTSTATRHPILSASPFPSRSVSFRSLLAPSLRRPTTAHPVPPSSTSCSAISPSPPLPACLSAFPPPSPHSMPPFPLPAWQSARVRGKRGGQNGATEESGGSVGSIGKEGSQDSGLMGLNELKELKELKGLKGVKQGVLDEVGGSGLQDSSGASGCLVKAEGGWDAADRSQSQISSAVSSLPLAAAAAAPASAPAADVAVISNIVQERRGRSRSRISGSSTGGGSSGDGDLTRHYRQVKKRRGRGDMQGDGGGEVLKPVKEEKGKQVAAPPSKQLVAAPASAAPVASAAAAAAATDLAAASAAEARAAAEEDRSEWRWQQLRVEPGELDLHLTFATGQTFRWVETGPGEFSGVVANRLVTLRQPVPLGPVSVCIHSPTPPTKEELGGDQGGRQEEGRSDASVKVADGALSMVQGHVREQGKDGATREADGREEGGAREEQDSAVLRTMTANGTDAAAATSYPNQESGCEAAEEVAVMAALEDLLNLHVNTLDLYRQFAECDTHFASLLPMITGYRILRQEPVECLFQFICSSNNHISRISSMVEVLSQQGPLVSTINGRPFHAFPSLHRLSSLSELYLRERGFGYRAAFIVQTACQLHQMQATSGTSASEWLQAMRKQAWQEVERQLCVLPGVGPKVAACVALLSLDQHAAVPVDTHVWQVRCAVWSDAVLGGEVQHAAVPVDTYVGVGCAAW
ncbi:unnamed protein product [Closterium sp. NIES-54]